MQKILPFKLATNLSMAATVHSSPFALGQAGKFMVPVAFFLQANYATGGSLTGTLFLEASGDYQQDKSGNVTNTGNWGTVEDSTFTLSGAGIAQWDVKTATYPWVRLTYVPGGGDAGTLNAWMFYRGH